MSKVDVNAVASAAIQDIQKMIDTLSALERQPNANIPSINNQIEALEDKQNALRTNALGAIIQSPDNADALQALQAASANLKKEANNINAETSVLDSTAKGLGYAADLLGAIVKLVG